MQVSITIKFLIFDLAGLPLLMQPDVSVTALERQLQEYLAAGSADRPFDMVRVTI
jgi:hypothetical protein